MSQLSVKQLLELAVFNKVVEEQTRQHPLRQLFWESTLRCNMKCQHCGSDCKVSTTHPDMPFEDFEKVLRRIKEAYDSHEISVVVTGGEPLMRHDIVECGRKIYSLEFPWGMVSNGFLMTDKKIDDLLGAGMRAATISLDGLEENHDWMRGVPGSFRNASHAIERLAKEPHFGFDVVTCVNQRNFRQLGEFKEYLISLGLKKWRIFTVFPVGRAAGNPELQIDSEQYRQLMGFIIDTRKEGRISVSYACEGFLGKYEGKVRDHLFTCQAGISIAGVRIDGSISACTSIRSNYDQGNIYTDDIVDVWENRFENMRDREWMHSGECADCGYWKYCHGNGLHLRDDEGRLIQCNLKKLSI
ncbi:MAG: TIGR04133 family radical SAM/SPASM protein [Bacteroidales bacterium]|nr:TIGR04133 family radical SAM/SPASM protein [Bacteroidales bacterium]